jgi:hypothetical protein
LLGRLCEDTPGRLPTAVDHLQLAGRKTYSVAEVYAAHRNADPQAVRAHLPRWGVPRDPDRVAFGFQ